MAKHDRNKAVIGKDEQNWPWKLPNSMELEARIAKIAEITVIVRDRKKLTANERR